MHMATLYVRDVPDTIYQAVQEFAATRQQSINACVNEILNQFIEQEQKKAVAKEALQKLRELNASQPAQMFDTTELLRQLRNSPPR